MELPRDELERMQVHPERAYFCFGPVDDTDEMACPFVDHDVARAETLAEENHG
jgi:hypothetical protein